MTSSLLVLYSGYLLAGTVVGVRQVSALSAATERRYACMDVLSAARGAAAIDEDCAAR